MTGNALTAMEDLYGGLRYPKINKLADQAKWDGVLAAICLDVIVRRNTGPFPSRKYIWNFG